MRKPRPELKVWLKRQNLSQVDWAMQLGISHLTVNNWILRGVTPSPIMRDLLAKKYPNCPLLHE